MHALVNVILGHLQTFKLQREEGREDVVVVAPKVNDLRAPLLHFLEHNAHETRVRLLPAPTTPQLPSVDDVAVEDQLVAPDMLQEMVHLVGLGVDGAEMDIGDDYGADVLFHEARRLVTAGRANSSPGESGTQMRRLRGRTATRRFSPAKWVSPSV